MFRRAIFANLLGLLLALPAFTSVSAQERFDWIETHIYFGLLTKQGEVVSQENWADFLDHEVTPRYPHGLTVVDTYGQSSTPVEGAQQGLTTKLLIIVHPDTKEETAKFEAIKSAFAQRFGEVRIFHTESPVRVVE